MSTIKEQKAQEKIMAILTQLNAHEAKNVIGAICNSLGQINEHSAQKAIRRLLKIELDRELYEFITSLDLKFMTQKDVLNACIEKFGKDRAPSRTGLNRVFNKLLDENGNKS
ncbi:primosomal protein [Vibrio barjaei]|uniref:primosomal protein n=1 Tax=Vibrio barjaei TaxID=1676683 RepID=UPI002284D897|nr:primosomal protein [Vibrio barjaei]MCY9873910.1 primosomal protein [Vibrio barjaei]